MSREQIDEMTKVLVDYTKKNHIMASHAILEDYAEQLYEAGYRTQSEGEWISVDERLPEIDGKYLAYTTRGTVELARCYSYVNGTHQFDYWITHWMPLPEAPKMKGGAE